MYLSNETIREGNVLMLIVEKMRRVNRRARERIRVWGTSAVNVQVFTNC